MSNTNKDQVLPDMPIVIRGTDWDCGKCVHSAKEITAHPCNKCVHIKDGEAQTYFRDRTEVIEDKQESKQGAEQ